MEVGLVEGVVQVLADQLPAIGLARGGDDPVLLDGGAIAQEQADVSAGICASGLRAEPGLRAGAAGVDRARNHLLHVRMAGDSSDGSHPIAAADQGGVRAADFLRGRGVDDVEGAFAPSIDRGGDGIVPSDAAEFVLALALDLAEDLPIAGGVDGLGPFAVEFVRDLPGERPELLDRVLAVLRGGPDDARSDDGVLVEHRQGGPFAVGVDHDRVGVGGVTDQAVIARSVQGFRATPAIHRACLRGSGKKQRGSAADGSAMEKNDVPRIEIFGRPSRRPERQRCGRRPHERGTAMTRTVHDALASHPVETTVHRRLHDVRPHEVFEVTYDGQRAVCKVAQHRIGDPELEGRILEFVDAETPVPVPPVLAVGEEHFVAGWCTDLPDDPAVDEVRSRAMGATLARLHEAAGDKFDASGHLSVDDGDLAVDADARWSDTLRALLEDRRRFLEPRGYGDLATEVLDLVETFPEAFDDVGSPTLLHGNVLPDHVGIDRSADPARATRVIDFEHALVGPPVFDLLRTIGPTFGPPGATQDPDGRAAFLDGYASIRPLPADLDETLRQLSVVNGVAYLRALHLQRGDRDEPQALARRAQGLATVVEETASELRAELRTG